MRKIIPSLEAPTRFNESFKFTSAPFFICDFNLLTCGFNYFTFKVLYWVILHWYYIKVKTKTTNHSTLIVPREKSKIVSFAFSIMKNINLLLFPLRFPVKLIYFFSFGPASNACCLLKSIAIILWCFMK